MSVGLGVVGLGWWGRVLADAAVEVPEVEVVSAFTRTQEKRDQFAANFGCTSAPSLEALLADDAVDGVLFTTPHTVHRENIEQAAAAGVHVLVEKPLTLNAADARAAIAAAKAGGIHLMVGHQRRRQSANRQIRAMLDDGTIGTAVQAEATLNVPTQYPDTWRANAEETPLGGMTGLGVHHLDTFHYLMGEVKRVAAFSNPVLDDHPLDHATGLLLEFATGAVGTLTTSHFAPATNRVSIWGTEGAAFAEGDGTQLFTQRFGEPGREPVDITINNPLVDQVAEFASVIAGDDGAVIETDGAVGLAVIEVFEAAIASARRGAVVEVDEFRAG